MFNQFSFFNSDSFEVPKLLYIGVNGNPDSARFGPGIREQYMVQYVLRGKGYFNGHLVTTGQGYYVTPNMLEEYYPDPLDPWEYLNISSRDKSMEELLPFYNADPETNIFSFDSVNELKSICQLLKPLYKKRMDTFTMTEFFMRIINSHIFIDSNPPGDKTLFIQAQNYIHAHLHTSLPVKDLTDTMNLSQQYLHKLFIKYSGRSPKQYILDAKLSHAKRLLRENPNLYITEVATSVGFPDVLTFSRFFSSREGMSPTVYRTAHEKKSL